MSYGDLRSKIERETERIVSITEYEHVPVDEEDEETEENVEAPKGAFSVGDPELNRLRTTCYCVNYFALGLAVGLLGPTLLEIAEKTGTDTEQMGSLFAARGIGWILGSIGAGKLYEHVKGHRVMWIALLVTTIVMFLVPIVANLPLLFFLHGCQGLVLSWVEVGVNTLTLWVWKDKVGPYMQLLHFAFGAGLGAAPFIVAVVVMIFPERYDLIVSYWFIAVLIGLSAFFSMKVVSPPIEKDFTEAQAHVVTFTAMLEDEGDTVPEPTVSFWERFRWYFLTTLVVVFFFLYGGAETSFGGWIFTYAFEVYNFTEPEASFLTSIFWAALTFGRFVAVPIASRVSSRLMLSFDLAGCIISPTIGIMFGHYRSKVLLWIVTITFGASMASIYGSAFSLPSELKCRVNSKAASAFIVASGIGDMIVPIFVGWFFSVFGDEALIWLVLVIFAVCFTIFLVVVVYGISTMEQRLDEVQLKELGHMTRYWKMR